MTAQRRTPGRPGQSRQARTGRTARTPASARAALDPNRAARSSRTPAPARIAGDPARSASRPASARRAAATGAAKRTRAPQPGRFTGRATALAFILIVLLLAYAYPMRVYLNQQAQIAALESDEAAQRLRIQQKQTQVAKWNDTDYIIAMAHKRLQMDLPGDIMYIATDPAGGAQNPGADPATVKVKDTGPWYGQLWSSLDAADRNHS